MSRLAYCHRHGRLTERHACRTCKECLREDTRERMRARRRDPRLRLAEMQRDTLRHAANAAARSRQRAEEAYL